MTVQETVASTPSLETAIRSFSCPHEPMDEEIATTLGVEHARQTVSMLVQQYRSLYDEHGRGIAALLEGWRTRDTTFNTVWNPAFSAAYYAMLNDDAARILNLSAALAVHVSASGAPGKWELRLPTAQRFRWDASLLPPAEQIAVASDGTRATVDIRAGDDRRTVTFTRNEQGWYADDVETFPAFGPAHAQMTIVPRSALTTDELELFVANALDAVTPTHVSLANATLDLLHQYAPMYVPWVQRTTRYLCPNTYQGLNSGTSRRNVGLVHATFSDNPMALAEMLVHENAHQHYNLLIRLGPVDDGSDTNQYYSPVVQKTRPLERILLAYHAFANVLLLYRLCRDADDGGHIARYEAQVEQQVAELEAPLRGNPALTPVGQSVFLPLFERIH